MNRRLVVTGTAALLTMAAPGFATDSYQRQAGVKIAHYTFDVALSDETDEIVMKEIVDVELQNAGIASINLDLCGPRARGAAPVTPGDPCAGPSGGAGLSRQPNSTAAQTATGMTVTAASAAGRALTFVQQGDVVHVTLPSPSQAGQRLTLTLEYHGVPATGLRIAPNKYQDRSFVSNDWPDLARNWLATIDHISMKAPITMTVTAPQKYQVISNGLRKQEVDLGNGMRRTVWDETVPIPTWEFALAVAPYAVDYFGSYHGIELSSWVFPQERDNGYKGFSEATPAILEFFSDHIGPYSYEKLAHVQGNSVSGGMELASNIFYGYNGIPGRQLVAHEMAHQWFGNSVSENDWDDVWLSEGFATYFALLYTEHQDGRDAFINGIRRATEKAMKYTVAHPDSTIVHKNLSSISQVIDNNAQVYEGGAQVLHMLRGVIGTETFWNGIRLYYRRFQNRNVSSDDFRTAMQDACTSTATCPEGGKDLTWFFDEWLTRGGILQVNGTWSYDATAKQLHVVVDQSQAQGLFRMPIEIGVTLPPAAPSTAGPGADSGNRLNPPSGPTRMMIVNQHNELVIPMESAPFDVKLDPNGWVTMMQGTLVKK